MTLDFASVAQSELERNTTNVEAAGSSPAGGIPMFTVHEP